MKKLIIFIVILAFVFVALGIAKKLPAPLQNFADKAAVKIFPAKDQLQKRIDQRAKTVTEQAEP